MFTYIDHTTSSILAKVTNITHITHFLADTVTCIVNTACHGSEPFLCGELTKLMLTPATEDIFKLVIFSTFTFYLLVSLMWMTQN